MLLEAKGIYKKYGAVEVLRDVSIGVEQGEIIAIVGASGAGKSTLLHVLGMLEPIDQGAITLSGYPIHLSRGDALARVRNQRIGFVFQFHQLLPEFTTIENVCMPGYIAGRSRGALRSFATELLDQLGLSHRMNHLPDALSGGEAQRVAIARALINEPDIVYADEPSGNLDSTNSTQLYELFATLSKERKQTFVIATHSLSLAEMADRRVEISDGALIDSSKHQVSTD